MATRSRWKRRPATDTVPVEAKQGHANGGSVSSEAVPVHSHNAAYDNLSSCEDHFDHVQSTSAIDLQCNPNRDSSLDFRKCGGYEVSATSAEEQSEPAVTGSFHASHISEDDAVRRERLKLEKLLREIEILEQKDETLSTNQVTKINRRSSVEKRLAELKTFTASGATFVKPMSDVLPQLVGAPQGLKVVYINENIVASVLEELRPHFIQSVRRKSTSSMFEIGLSFLAADHGQLEPAKPLKNFPKVQQLLAESMLAISGGSDFHGKSLNVICRQYLEGQGMPTHVDRREMFDEDVYGCVLTNSSDSALTFQQTNRSGEVLRTFRIDELAGACFRQRGDARYKWSHGVEPLASGERISVTWRWFAADYLLTPSPSRQTKQHTGATSHTTKYAF